jgi:hypothetical protein
LHGTRPLTDPSVQETRRNRALVRKAARWYVYRLTWTEYENAADGRGFNDLFREVSEQLPVLNPGRPFSENQQAFLGEFCNQLLASIEEILPGQKVIVRVNAARILARIGEAGQESVADALLRVLEDPAESEAVKLYALRGLKHLFARHSFERPVFRDSSREHRSILALLAYLKQTPATTPASTTEELDGIRYVRREAVRALALVRYPALPGDNQADGMVALALLQFVQGKEVRPEPSLSERVEAAIGLCQLDPSLCPDYQPDHIAFQLGRFVVVLAEQHNRQEQLIGSDLGLPWQMSAARLLEAMGRMAENTDDLSQRQLAETVFTRCNVVLETIAEGANPDPGSVDVLDRWLRENKPPNNAPFKKALDAIVHP